MDNIASTSFRPQSHGSESTPAQLRVPVVPDFPFSSPIIEEVMTPFDSPDILRPRDIPPAKRLESPENSLGTNPFTGNEMSDASGQGGFTLERYANPAHDKRNTRWHSVRRPTRANSKRSVKDTSTKKKRPGLNLVTDFATDETRRLRDGVTKRPRQAEHGVFVDLKELKSLSKEKEKEKAI